MQANNAAPIITSVGYGRLTDLVLSARDRVIFCAPNVHREVAHALAEAARDVDVTVVLDAAEDNYRNGFGDILSADVLLKAGASLHVAHGNHVSFVIADDEAYFLFPQSRIFSVEGEGTNAVRMDPLICERILLHFFPPSTPAEEQQARQRLDRSIHALNQVIEEASEELAAGSERSGTPPLDLAELEAVRKRLDLDPPLDPDLRRRISVYTAKLQFVELEFAGSNFHVARVQVPESAVPFRNEELRRLLEARLRLFKDLPERKEFEPLFAVRKELDRIRDTYLVHVQSRKKNVVHKDQKATLVAELEQLKEQIGTLNEQLQGAIAAEILRSKRVLREEITLMLHEAPQNEWKSYPPGLFQETVEDEAYRIVAHIQFPTPDRVLDKLGLSYRFFDLTWEDFQDTDFRQELQERGVIKEADAAELRSLHVAYQANDVSRSRSHWRGNP